MRELEQDGLIHRKVYAQVPPKVEYRLSELGYSLEPILRALKNWGDEHIDLYGKVIEPTEKSDSELIIKQEKIFILQ